MSMHRIPLTPLEEEGLKAHGLGRYIGKPSQSADIFRQGVKWALENSKPAAALEWNDLIDKEPDVGQLCVVLRPSGPRFAHYKSFPDKRFCYNDGSGLFCWGRVKWLPADVLGLPELPEVSDEY